MNRYPAWKYILLTAVVAFGIIYALPNLFGDDPAVQVSSARGFELDPALQGVVEDVVDAEEIQVKTTEFSSDRLMLRVNSSEQQLALADALRDQLGDAYVVALNLAPATPDWLRAVSASPMVLGLDLQGGVHFLMEVDMDTARSQQLERFVDDIRNLLRDQSIRYRSVRADREALVAELRTAEDRQTAMAQISADLPELELEPFDGGETFNIRATVRPEVMTELQQTALQQNITTLRNRVNELGVAEPIIQQQGADRIVVQLPGVQDTAEAKRILGSTATLEYRAVDEQNDPFEAQRTGRVPPQSRLYTDREGNPVLLSRRVIAAGDQLINASAGFAQDTGQPMVRVTLDAVGARRMFEFTSENVGNRMAVVIIEERTVGPSLGADNIQQGFNSVIIGFCLVLVLMAVYYKVFGLVANLALTANLVLVVALLSMIGATLTLPGIAGIVLTVGMAVDANVLIFERIKEELRLGNTPQAALRAGYGKAFSTIADASVTTLIAALVLFMFGTGPVKGFAVTLSLGIVTSMFTAIFGTRGVINLIYGGRKRVKSLAL